MNKWTVARTLKASEYGVAESTHIGNGGRSEAAKLPTRQRLMTSLVEGVILNHSSDFRRSVRLTTTTKLTQIDAKAAGWNEIIEAEEKPSSLDGVSTTTRFTGLSDLFTLTASHVTEPSAGSR